MATLDKVELFIFALMELETLMDMEGWTHFFASPQSAALYPELKLGLTAANDHASLSVLGAFERYLSVNRIALAPAAIDEHFLALDGASLKALPDWRSQFAAAAAHRWELISKHLAIAEIELVVSEETEATTRT